MIRDVPDFPKKGIIFKDITPLLKDKDALKECIDKLTAAYKNKKIDKIVSMESRGFILGSALAYTLGCGFVPVRKKNKLPWQTVSVTYDLEYGTDTLEMHKDACAPGENVLIVDDVLATGGTAQAVTKMIEGLGAKVTGLCFLIELSFLNPRKKLEGREIFSLLTY
ncbi:MAG: adenine phosphoribosyltransferase [Elusimicrobia bacterium]|nr:adenine phosphoribosyltransferase [Elusimicrobiota bacterium]MBU2614001.1 adenine phosphoribosyltransferase [Elusimicrobiota bacterium]